MMRSSDEQLMDIKERAQHIKQKKKVQRRLLMGAVPVCAAFVLIVTAAGFLPEAEGPLPSFSGMGYGTLLSLTGNMGYVLVFVLAFLLGICVTILCVRLSRQDHDRDRKDADDDRDFGAKKDRKTGTRRH